MDIENMAIAAEHIPDLAVNEFHPMNDQFNQEIKHVQNMIMATQRQMKPKHVRMVKLAFAGHTYTKIGEMVGKSLQTVSKTLKNPDAQRLLSLLKYLDSAMTGPSASLRIAMLYRIAKKNEDINPKVTISAVAELNKMQMNEHTMNSEVAPTTTTIIINAEQLPRTPLDG